MAFRPGTTLLLVTDRELVRADYTAGKSPRLLDNISGGNPGGAIETQIEAAIGLGGKLGKSTFVLADSIYLQTLDINRQSIQGLSGSELSQALQFEIESFSGMGAFEARLGFVEVGQFDDESRFLVCQTAQSELATVQELIASYGSKLVGMTHPAASPVNAAVVQASFWNQIALIQVAELNPPLVVVNADPRSERCYDEMERLGIFSISPDDVSVTTVIGPSVALPHEHEIGQVLNLSDQESLDVWLTNWASSLSPSCDQAAWIRLEKEAVSQQTKWTGAAFAAAIAVLICVGDWFVVNRSTQQLVTEREQILEPAEKLKQYDKALTSRAKEREALLVELKSMQQKASGVEMFVSAGRKRMALLLKCLAEEQTEDLQLQAIESSTDGIDIRGISLNLKSSTIYASRLAERLKGQGWEVSPPTQHGTEHLSTGGPWEFRVSLKDVPPTIRENPEVDSTQENGQLSLSQPNSNRH